MFDKICEFIADKRTLVLIGAFVTSMLVLFGVPAEKQESAWKVILAGNAVAALYISKLHKEAPPAKPSAGAGDSGPPDESPAETPTTRMQIVRDPPGDEFGGPSITGAIGLVLSVAVMLASAGCGTSTAFSKAAWYIGPGLAANAARYVQKDATLSDVPRAERVLATENLRLATSAESIVASQVGSAWDQVKPFYVQYIQADPSLDVMERKLRIDVATAFDKLLADELGRPFAPVSPVPGPSPGVPAPTQPAVVPVVPELDGAPPPPPVE